MTRKRWRLSPGDYSIHLHTYRYVYIVEQARVKVAGMGSNFGSLVVCDLRIFQTNLNLTYFKSNPAKLSTTG